MAKTVLITGVSSGIGRVTAELFARNGWQVVGTVRDTTSMGAWASANNVLLLPLDVTSEQSVATAVNATLVTYGTIDALVNNAGYGQFGPLEGASSEDVELQFATNVFGVIALIRHVMPLMRKRREGVIVNVGSLGGRFAAPFASLYHATKFAIEGLSESLRYEASLHGVRVKVVEPSLFKTGFITRSLRKSAHPDYDAAFTNYMGWVYLENQKAPTPEAVAKAILKAAEDRSPKLRYPVKSWVLLTLTRILPDAVFRSLLAQGMTRKPKLPSDGGQ
jgi:NAD(P)-dependent dehydrogenase (short-subunit alcohol dehydrogenase family)